MLGGSLYTLQLSGETSVEKYKFTLWSIVALLNITFNQSASWSSPLNLSTFSSLRLGSMILQFFRLLLGWLHRQLAEYISLLMCYRKTKCDTVSFMFDTSANLKHMTRRIRSKLKSNISIDEQNRYLISIYHNLKPLYRGTMAKDIQHHCSTNMISWANTQL